MKNDVGLTNADLGSLRERVAAIHAGPADAPGSNMPRLGRSVGRTSMAVVVALSSAGTTAIADVRPYAAPPALAEPASPASTAQDDGAELISADGERELLRSARIARLERLLARLGPELAEEAARINDGEADARARLPTQAPLSRLVRSSGYGERIDPITGRRRMHAGEDFRGPLDSPVRATGDGVVSFSGQRSGYGNTVEVDHGNGLTTRYAHLDSLEVRRGERVRHGDQVGGMGATGRATGVHLHYEVLSDGDAVDPQPFIDADLSLSLRSYV